MLDPKDIKDFSLNVWSYKQGELVSLMIHLGDTLGLYRALDGAGPVTASAESRKARRALSLARSTATTIATPSATATTANTACQGCLA